MNIYVSIDERGYTEKLEREIVSIKKRTVENWRCIEAKELAYLVGNKGFAMVPGHLVGGMKSNNCTEMQLFALDFDHGVSYREIKKKCDRMNLPISFAYHTFSSSVTEERFRIVFAYECVLRDLYVINVIKAMLKKIFPESDQSCHNLDRIFLGGKDLIYVDENAYIALVQLLTPLLENLDTGGNLKRNIHQFCMRNKIAVLNNRPAVGYGNDIETYLKIDEFKDPAIYKIHNVGESTNSSNFILESKDVVQKSITRRMGKHKISPESAESCRLLKDFLEGEILSHNTRFAILTNLIRINGGRKTFLDTIQEYYDTESHEKWEKTCKYVNGYFPQRCSCEFCPYIENCDNRGTIVETLKSDRKVYKEEEELHTLAAAEAQLEINLRDAYEYGGKGIHIVIAQTALGKTEAYIDLIKEHPGCKFLIAVPTNKLKKEIYGRLWAAGISKEEIYITLSASDNSLIPKEIKERIKEAHERGLHQKGKEYIRDYYDEIKENPDKKAVAEACKKLLDGLKGVEEERIIVTTHAFFLQIPEEFLDKYTVIIDEDILQLQILNKISSVSAVCLEELAESGYPAYAAIAGQMSGAEENVYQKISAASYVEPLNEEQLEELGTAGDDNINDLRLAGSFVKLRDEEGNPVVKYFCPSDLPRAKMIVLSATINENIYRRYFEGKQKVYTYPVINAEYMGKLVQYTYHSLGRRSLLNKQGIFDLLPEITGKRDIDIITFKMIEERYGCTLNGYDLHFGNSAGIDALKGKDIAIVGTPFSVEESYKLIACYLGADVNKPQDKMPRMRRISHNGCNFVFVTYEEALLREIQIYAIESELEQCIGRARLLRENCIVYLFSSFPCQQAEIHMLNYLLEK